MKDCLVVVGFEKIENSFLEHHIPKTKFLRIGSNINSDINRNLRALRNESQHIEDIYYKYCVSNIDSSFLSFFESK